MHTWLLAHKQTKHPGLSAFLACFYVTFTLFFSLLALSFCAALGGNTQFLFRLWNSALDLCSRHARSLGTRHKPGCCVLEASGTGVLGVPQRNAAHGGEGREKLKEKQN